MPYLVAILLLSSVSLIATTHPMAVMTESVNMRAEGKVHLSSTVLLS